MTRDEFQKEMHRLVDQTLDQVSASKEEDHFLPHFVSVFLKWQEKTKSPEQMRRTCSRCGDSVLCDPDELVPICDLCESVG